MPCGISLSSACLDGLAAECSTSLASGVKSRACQVWKVDRIEGGAADGEPVSWLDVRMGAGIFVEEWHAAYGSPYLVAADDAGVGEVELLEDGDRLQLHSVPTAALGHPPVAFVDGVRRVEANLYQHDPATGEVVRGVAGSHACGAVVADGEHPPRFVAEEVRRLVILGSNRDGTLSPVPGGWRWSADRVAGSEPDAPMVRLQQLMREAEGLLADRLCRRDWLVLVDGPLTYARSRDQPVAGYVKTHSTALLPPEHHRRIPELGPAQRSSLFRFGERYSCYLRLAPASRMAGPWAGIVRLEMPCSAGLDAAVAMSDALASILPRYAGVAHRDPRAPQNLQPVAALETRLRHLLGDARLAYRAVREAIAREAAVAGS